VGERIRARRKALGLTLEKLAFESGLDKGHLSRLERGLQSPRIRTLRAIADRLNAPVSDLVSDRSGDGYTRTVLPAFEHHPSVAKAAETASKLVAAGVPVLLLGAAGTGRRSLAKALAGQTGAETTPHMSGQPLPSLSQVAKRVLVLGHPAELPTTDALRLVAWIADGGSVIAYGDREASDNMHSDLASRFSGGLVSLPPLHERGDDVVRWALHFITQGGRSIGITEEARTALLAHPWTGNLAELEALVTRALVLSDPEAKELSAQDLGLTAKEPPVEPLSDAVDRFRREYVVAAVERCGGNRSRAARLLSVDPRTVFRLLKG